MAEQLKEGLERLKRLTKTLEDPKLGLEEAMATYEEAKHLETELRERLAKTEMIVEIISADGKILPFTDEGEKASRSVK